MRDHEGDDHQGPQAHARHRSCARRGRAGGRGRHRLSTRDVFDRAAATYDVAAFPFFTPFGEALVEFARIAPDERVLDVGCGAGAALAPASRVAARAVGVELSAPMAERARVAAPAAEVIVGDATSLEFEDGSFDVVLSAFTVFFMPDPTAALREWGRVLAPGGRICVSTWAGSDPRWAFERQIRRAFLAELSPALLKELAEQLVLLDRFNELGKARAELEAAGLTVREQREHPIDFVYPDPQAWWDLNWSHGIRAFLEPLSEASRRRLLEEMTQAMEQVRESNGFSRTFTGLFTAGTIA